MLIGNKLDKIGVNDSVRQVSEEEAKKFCENNYLKWGGEISLKYI